MFPHRTSTVLLRLLRLPCNRLVTAAPGLKKVTAFFVMLFQLFGALLFDWPTTPDGTDFDMSRFELVWQDEFDQGTLDLDKWGGHYVYGVNDCQPRDTAWWTLDQVSIVDSQLVITAEFREDGPRGAKYYSCGIDTAPQHNFNGRDKGYEQLYGYFEVRAKFPAGDGFNPAFWLLCEGMFEGNPSGVGGCEIDVFETKTNPSGKDKRWKDSVYHTIHVGSYDENHKSEMQGHFYVDNPTGQFNTYGVEWNENEYIWYINGVESARTSFAGACRVPLYLIVSLGVDEYVNKEQLPAEFAIDYVRAYQYK